MFRSFCLQQTWSNRDWICPSHKKQPNQDKTEKIYETPFSGKQQATKDSGPERGDSNEVGLWLPRLTASREFPGCRASRGTSGGTRETPRAGKTKPMTHEHMARHSTPWVAGKMRIKTTRKYHYTLIKHLRALSMCSVYCVSIVPP